MMSSSHAPVLFFAIWPDSVTQVALGEWAQQLAHRTGGRATPAEKIHLTLVYLGATPCERLPALRAMAASIREERFVLQLDRVGWWKHNRIAWAGAVEIPHALAQLERQLRLGSRSAGMEPDQRAYAPHVTLVRKGKQALAAQLMPPIAWKAERFCLMHSVASRYALVEEWALQEHNLFPRSEPSPC